MAGDTYCVWSSCCNLVYILCKFFFFISLPNVNQDFLKILLISSHPSSHKCIKKKELDYLSDHVPHSNVKKSFFAVPWKDIMTSKVTWAVIASQLGHDWGYFVMITCLPKYVAQVLQFSIKSNGVVTSLPFIAMFICTNLSGCLADHLIKKDKINIGIQRKLWTFIGKYFKYVNFPIFPHYPDESQIRKGIKNPCLLHCCIMSNRLTTSVDF